ncbi:hypothetical protein A33I_20965 [Alkalihalophilus marmarensis DSM 21297]|uniref:Reverse transcriptase (RNA-dependent DNA polymerase) n=1 Tax=Alkalihalophilus marmarensis DSM 21297 TaxID=1188261 RepID=U6SIB9_9BACI|nr:hypothetical protein A33I_20965 [Alkalihalophilus marmarensis DSM 21297]
MLFSNIMFNEFDMELESCGFCFVCYVDDCIIMVKSEMVVR